MSLHKKKAINKKLWLNIAAYAFTGILFLFIARWISGNYDGADRRLYLGLMLIAAYFFGLVVNWLVLRLFDVDISK